jgi:hypothetical protein
VELTKYQTEICLWSTGQSRAGTGPVGPVEKVNWAGRDRNFTAWNFWKISSFDRIFGHKNWDVAYFFGRIRKKVLKIYVILIIYSKVLCKKIDYVECLLQTFLKYLIFSVIFSKNRFSREFAIFSRVFNRLNRNFTVWTCGSNSFQLCFIIAQKFNSF